MKYLNDISYKDCVGKIDDKAYNALMNYEVEITD